MYIYIYYIDSSCSFNGMLSILVRINDEGYYTIDQSLIYVNVLAKSISSESERHTFVKECLNANFLDIDSDLILMTILSSYELVKDDRKKQLLDTFVSSQYVMQIEVAKDCCTLYWNIFTYVRLGWGWGVETYLFFENSDRYCETFIDYYNVLGCL